MAVLSRDEARRERARKHSYHEWTCSLRGKRVRGNGGKSSHMRMHKREAHLPYESFGWVVQRLDEWAKQIEEAAGKGG